MADPRSLLDRAAAEFEPGPDLLERTLGRVRRRQRNRRIAAAAVALAIAAAGVGVGLVPFLAGRGSEPAGPPPGSIGGSSDAARFRLLQLREVIDSSATDRSAMAARPFTTGVIRPDDPYRRDPRFAEAPPDQSGDMVTFEDLDGDGLYAPDREPKVLLGPVRVSGRDVRSAIATVVAASPGHPRWQVEFALDEEGTRVFREVTSRLVGRQLATVVDGVVLSAAVVQATISQGRGAIAGRFTERQARELAAALSPSTG